MKYGIVRIFTKLTIYKRHYVTLANHDPGKLFSCFWPRRLGLGPRQVFVEIVLKKWHWGRFLPQHCGFNPSVLIHQCPLSSRLSEGQPGEKWGRLNNSIALPKIICVGDKTAFHILVFIWSLRFFICPLHRKYLEVNVTLIYSLCRVLLFTWWVFLFLVLWRNVRISCRRRVKRTDTTVIEVRDSHDMYFQFWISFKYVT
jgi:hypothetical protein